jgi:hypothetical protein
LIGFDPPKGATIDWFLGLPGQAHEDSILDTAMAALSLVHIAKTNSDNNALIKARMSYGNTLKQFQSTIKKRRADANSMSAVICMGLYEVSIWNFCAVSLVLQLPEKKSSEL